jgi:hypothetical protein
VNSVRQSVLTNHSSVDESRGTLLPRELPARRAAGEEVVLRTAAPTASDEAIREGTVVAGEVGTCQEAGKAKGEDCGGNEDGEIHPGKAV